MHRKTLLAALLMCAVLLNPAMAQDVPTLKIMTEDWVPYQFERDGKPVGIAVDALVLMLERVGSEQGRADIEIYPWARAYKRLLSQRNALLFSTTRTREREKLFKWVGPIFANTTYLIAKKSKDIEVSCADGLHAYRIGTIIGDASELFMTRLGLTTDALHRNTSSTSNIRKLEADRIDLVVSGWIAFKNDALSAGVDPDLYEAVFEVDSSEVSYAFNPATPDAIIERLQRELDRMKTEGVFAEIVAGYEHLLQ